MEIQSTPILIELQGRLARLEKRANLFMVGNVALIGTLLLGAWRVSNTDQVLSVKQLNVIDDKGVKRIILAAPTPDPIMGGKPQPRRSSFSGLLLNGSDGDEMGGFGLLSDGTESMCFDQGGRERACMYVLPNGRTGFLLQDAKGKQRFGTTVEAEGKPTLQFFDEQEKPILAIPDK